MSYFCHVKLLKQFVSWTIWGIIAINLMLIGLSHFPTAQRYIGSKVADAVGSKLGTLVSVGRINPGFLNRIIVDDVLIYDQQRKEMIRVGRLTAKIDIAPLTEGKISISSAQLFGAHLKLYRKSYQDQPNFQFALDSLVSKDTTNQTPLDLRINSFILRNSSVSYDQMDQNRTDGVFNPAHLSLTDISANISLKKLTEDSLNINIKRFGLHEQSGLDITRVNLKLEAGRNHALLSDLLVEMPSSQLQIDTLTANYQLDENRLKPGSLSFYGKIENTGITLSDLRCFVPILKNYQRTINLNSAFNGTDQQFTVSELNIATIEKDVDINASGWIENWDRSPAWHLEMNHVNMSETSIDFLTKTFRQVPTELNRIGYLQMTGTFDRNLRGESSLLSKIQSGAGNIDVQLYMTSDRIFSGNMSTENLSLQQLLADDTFGEMAAILNLNGLLKENQKPDITVNGVVKQFDYRGYTYSDIALNGQYEQESISGAFSIDDPNLIAQLRGEITTDLFEKATDKAKIMRLQGEITHFAPGIVNLTDQWGDAVFAAHIDADFTAHNLNDAQGSIRLNNFSMSGSEKNQPYQYLLDNLTLTSGYDEGIHFLALKSDFADAELKGHFDYNTLLQSFVNAIGSKLPTLPGLPATTQNTDNNFNLRLLMSKADWLKHLFGIDLQLTQPMSIQTKVNARTREINMDGYFPAFIYDGTPYSDGSIRITSPLDTMKCDLSFTKLVDNGHHLKVDLHAGACDNHLTTSLRWNNNQTREEHMSGELNTVMQFRRNLENKPEAEIHVVPSHIILNNSTWNVASSDIRYYENHLTINNFSVHHGSQYIMIDGTASKRATDSLKVDINDVEVGYILDLVNFHSVEFSGRATGAAMASSLFGHFDAAANLKVEDFKFENGRMGLLQANVEWNKEKEQIDIHAIADDGPEAQTYINGYVSPTHETIDLNIEADGTYIDFMHNFTKSFISSITGHANGNARVAGTLDNINLTGQLVVDGEASVTPLNTTYTLQRDTVVMIPDDIRLLRLRVYDREGNVGYLSGGIHHQHLTHLSYDLSVETDNLLAYDFTDFGDASFYGTVYASGNVTIHGIDNEVVIDCNVTPLKNSVFVYNAANPDAIANQEFIEWETAGDNTSNVVREVKNNRATDTDIYLNFLINTTPDATLRLLMDANTKDYITLNGEGAIRATFHNKGSFDMFGTYTVDHGTYGITIQNIIKKNFTFNRGGTIVFGGDPYNAALNLQAVYTVNGVSLSDLNIGNSFTNNTIRVNCLMNIGGQPNAPQVNFDLEMPTVNADEQQMVRSVINGQQEMNQQVVYLLGIGRFYNQGSNNSNEQQSDQTSLAMQSFLSGTLSTQINTLLNQFIKNENWNFGANISTGNEGWHNAEYEGIINGRMLNNRLLFNGQFGYRDNATQANPSFIGDFDLQYLLYPNGNLALKVYNQTNDRYFTKSSLNTQGIGIIMKKDFNGLRDLFSSEKKKRKKQQQTELLRTDIKEEHSK